MDGGWTFESAEAAAEAGEPWPHRCMTVHVNFSPGGDVTAQNGATEIFQGSHHTYTVNDRGDPSVPLSLDNEGHLAKHTSQRNEFAHGAVAFRDPRIWRGSLHAPLHQPSWCSCGTTRITPLTIISVGGAGIAALKTALARRAQTS
jgi:hypothetical protein